MSKNEAMEAFAKAVFSGEKVNFTMEDFNELLEAAETQQERDFYVYIYNYFLKLNSMEVIARGQF